MRTHSPITAHQQPLQSNSPRTTRAHVPPLPSQSPTHVSPYLPPRQNFPVITGPSHRPEAADQNSATVT
ncbi:hypothetical protein ACFX1R_018240 [Malus domestica]